MDEPTQVMVDAGYHAAKADGLTGTSSSCKKLVRLILTAALRAHQPSTAGEKDRVAK